MPKSKTVKGLVKNLLDIADTLVCDLKGFEELTENEYAELVNIIGSIQNSFSDIESVLKKYNINWGLNGYKIN